jgi:hypothetical protein
MLNTFIQWLLNNNCIAGAAAGCQTIAFMVYQDGDIIIAAPVFRRTLAA